MDKYIDREALLLRIDCYGTNKFGMLDEDIRAFIKAQPASDVAPVRHGRWIMVDDSCGKYACSACREIEQECTEWGAGHYNPVDKDYCPNCGAKMDETVEDDER